MLFWKIELAILKITIIAAAIAIFTWFGQTNATFDFSSVNQKLTPASYLSQTENTDALTLKPA